MDSYDSRYPLEYYELGEKYRFYKGLNSNCRNATDDELKKYFKKFNQDDNKLSGKVELLRFNRLVGIVVGKHKADIDIPRDLSYINVLFDDEIVSKYVIEYSGVFFDEKERKLEAFRYDFDSLPTSDKIVKLPVIKSGIAPDMVDKGGSKGIAPDKKDIKQNKKDDEKSDINKEFNGISTGIVPDQTDRDMESSESISRSTSVKTYIKQPKNAGHESDLITETGEIATGIAPDSNDDD